MSEFAVFQGYRHSGEFAAFSDSMGERFVLSRSQCEERLRTLQSRGRGCSVTKVALQGWPTRQLGGIRGLVARSGGVGGSIDRESNRHVRRVEMKHRAT